MSNFHYWAWIGTIYLIMLTWQDYKNGMMVDDRKNYFMMGASFMLFSHFSRPLWYFILVISIVMIFNWFQTKYMQKFIGKGDISAISWILLGYSILDLFYPAIFMIYLIGTIFVMYVTILVFKKITKRTEQIPVPFFAIFLLTFIATNLTTSLYH